MATIASLDIRGSADFSDLTRKLTDGAARIQRFATSVEAAAVTLPVDADTEPLRLKLQSLVREARDLSDPLNLSTTDAQRELAELQGAFAGVEGALKRIDPTGVFRVIATETERLTVGLQGTVTQVAKLAAGAQQVGLGGAGAGSADPFAVARTGATSLASALERTTVAAKAAHAASGEPVVFPTAPAVGAADTLLTRLGLVTRAAGTVRAALSAPIPPLPPLGPNLDRLAHGYEGFAVKAEEARQANQRLLATMLQEGQAARKSAGDNEAAAAALGSIGRAQTTVAATSANAHRGLNLLRGAGVALAAQSLGLSGSLGSLGTGLLFLAGVAPEVVIGIAAITLAIDAIEGPTRRAQKATEDLIEKLKQAEKARQPDFTQLADQITDVRKASDEAIARLQQLTIARDAQALRGDRRGAPASLFAGQTEKEIALVKELQDQLAKLIPLQAQLQEKATSGAGTALIADLGLQVAAFGRSEAALKKYRLELQDGMTPAQRTAAGALLDMLDGLEKQKRRSDEAAAAVKKHTEALLEQQRTLRIERGGGGNRTAGDFGFSTEPVIAEVPVILRPALQREQFGTAEGDEITAELERAKRAANELAAALQGVDLKLKDIGNANITGPGAQLDAFIADLDNIQFAANGLGEVAGAFGDIGAQAEQGLQGVNQLFDSVKAFATGDILGGIASGLSSLANIGNAVFGKSQHQQEIIAALDRNRAAIDHNSLVLDRKGAAISAETAAAAIDAAAAVPDHAQGGAKGGGLLNPDVFDQRVADSLKPLGLDLQDLDKIAKGLPNPIELFDSQGHVIAGALDQFNEALKSGAIPLDQLAAAADSVTNALINVPEGFKIASARFNATRAIDAGSSAFPVPEGGSFDPSGTSRSPVSFDAMHIGTVEINISGAGKNADELADKVLERLQRRAMFSRGRSVDWAENN